MKNILFVQRNYNLATAQEALDVLLMACTFNQNVSLLFLEESVFLLKQDQDLAKILLKNFIATYKALPIYEINKIYVDGEALAKNKLKTSDLLLPVILQSPQEISDLLQQQDSILSF